MPQTFEFIIVGGGSAGCVIASRLSQDPDVRVLLIEAGPPHGRIMDFWKIDMPAAFDRVFMDPRYSWNYPGEPEPGLRNRKLVQPRGKVLGGSSSINGLCFIRAHRKDFGRWQEAGVTGWSWDEVLPYFKRSETWERGEDAYRGGNGPVHVKTGPMRTPLYEHFLNAGIEMGFPKTEDINGTHQEGFGAFQMNIRDGVRASTAAAYIRPNEGRSNLKVCTGALATKLVIVNKRAKGVQYLLGSTLHTAIAEREVVVCGGAVASPQLLMLSGIGCAEDLKVHGIVCEADLPGVGQNLQDHPIVHQKFSIGKPISISGYMRPDRMAYAGARWLLTHTGPAATNNVETCGWVRTDPALPQPDVLFQLMPVITDNEYRVKAGIHGFTNCVETVNVEARGWVKLRTRNPVDLPRILSNVLNTDADIDRLCKAYEIGRELASQPAYRTLGVKEADASRDKRKKQSLKEYLRENVVGDYHLAGTCSMGTDRMAVVDSNLNVRGIESLRVADASVMPTIVSANTNATAIMIGEKAADLIKQRAY
jgi:choline dehydrogenase